MKLLNRATFFKEIHFHPVQSIKLRGRTLSARVLIGLYTFLPKMWDSTDKVYGMKIIFIFPTVLQKVLCLCSKLFQIDISKLDEILSFPI